MAGSIPDRSNVDVRMRGFSARTTVEAAVEWIDSVLPDFSQLATEDISLAEAASRVLACNVTSGVNVPNFARSMMDGYALRAEETQGASSYNRLSLRILGTCLPGNAFASRVGAGEAVRIMTGAPLPVGTDAVLPVEETEIDGETVLVLNPVSPGKHVGQVGEDIRIGDLVQHAGRVLRPQDVGVLSSIGIRKVTAVRRPRVRILITGNELLPAGTPPVDFQIPDANGPMLSALVRRDGGESIPFDIIPDDPEAIHHAFLQQADVVLVSGGSSVGQEDFVPKLLADHGELVIHGIAMRPSRPTGMGRIEGTLVFLLPGNPVSCLCAYDFFAGRAIRALGGRARDWPYRRISARLSRKLISTVGRVDYARVIVRGDEAEPISIGGASILSSTTRADGFVVVPADSEGYPPGAEVDVHLFS